MTIIESLTQQEEHRKQVQKPAPSELMHTIVEDAGQGITRAEKEVISEKNQEQEYTSDKTVID